MSLANKRYVIAGNYEEYKSWLKGRTTVQLSHNEFIYVNDVQQLMGQRNISGVFTGTYRKRHDIVPIVGKILESLLYNKDARYNAVWQLYLDVTSGQGVVSAHSPNVPVKTDNPSGYSINVGHPGSGGNYTYDVMPQENRITKHEQHLIKDSVALPPYDWTLASVK